MNLRFCTGAPGRLVKGHLTQPERPGDGFYSLQLTRVSKYGWELDNGLW